VKVLKEPLLHFALAGAVLFGGYALVNRGEPDTVGVAPIHIGDGELRWLRETFANQWRREPTSEELNGLVASLLEEELLAREARALGLDQNDTIVRRRLAQKLNFLVEDTSHLVEPTDEELRQFYSANIERFQRAPRVSFTQIFFNPQLRQKADSDAKAALISLSDRAGQGDAPAVGDPLLLEANVQDVDQQSLSNMFGAEFAEAVFALRTGAWSGPIKSGFGVHLVRVTNFVRAAPPSFEAVRDKVLEEWRRQRECEMKASYLAKLREKYSVVIDDSVKPSLAPEVTGGAIK